MFVRNINSIFEVEPTGERLSLNTDLKFTKENACQEMEFEEEKDTSVDYSLGHFKPNSSCTLGSIDTVGSRHLSSPSFAATSIKTYSLLLVSGIPLLGSLPSSLGLGMVEHLHCSQSAEETLRALKKLKMNCMCPQQLLLGIREHFLSALTPK